MTYAEIVKTLASRLDLSQAEVRRMWKQTSKILEEILDKEVHITIPGWGTFFAHLKQKRKCFDPYHKHYLLLPPKRVVRFHAGPSIHDAFKDKRL